MLRDYIEDDIWNFMRSTVNKRYMDPQVVSSLMILIMKVDNQHTFKEFQPIRLCNVASKLVSKVMVNRLRLMLIEFMRPLLISNLFIPMHGLFLTF